MHEDEEPGGRTPPLAGTSSRKGVLRRLLDGLSPRRGETPPPGDPRRLGRYRILHRLGQGGMGIVFAAEDDEPRPQGRGEDDRRARRVGPQALPPRGARGGRRQPPERVPGLRDRRGRRAAVHRHGAARGRVARRAPAARTAVAWPRRSPLARGMLAALAALHETGIAPPRPQALEHVPDLPRREAPRLRSRASAPPRADAVARDGHRAHPARACSWAPRATWRPSRCSATTPTRAPTSSPPAAILYEAIAGRPAFLGTSVVEVLSATLHEQPPALAGDAAVVALDRLIRRALAKRPAERPGLRRRDGSPSSPRSRSATARRALGVARPLTRLAVLPFRLLRPDPEIDFLSFALADAVSASLAGLPSIVVRSSAAVSRFAGERPGPQGPRDAGRRRPRRCSGTLLRAGEQLRVTTQLVEAPAGTLVSTQTLQSPMGDVFRLQDELAQRIVESLSPSLAGREGARRRGVPASARAYEFYLRANEVVRDWAQVAGGARPLPPVRRRGPGLRAGVGQARPLPPAAGQVLPRATRGEPRAGRGLLPARARARPGADRRPQALRAPRVGDGARARGDGAAPGPGALDAQRPRDLRRPRARVPLLRPAGGLRGGPPRGAAPRPAHLDERRLHLVGAGRDGAHRRRDFRRLATSSCA